jgi:hypothetical protein
LEISEIGFPIDFVGDPFATFLPFLYELRKLKFCCYAYNDVLNLDSIDSLTNIVDLIIWNRGAENQYVSISTESLHHFLINNKKLETIHFANVRFDSKRDKENVVVPFAAESHFSSCLRSLILDDVSFEDNGNAAMDLLLAGCAKTLKRFEFIGPSFRPSPHFFQLFCGLECLESVEFDSPISDDLTQHALHTQNNSTSVSLLQNTNILTSASCTTLTTLTLEGPAIKSLSFLKTCSVLEKVVVKHAWNLADVSGLAELPSLAMLDLNWCPELSADNVARTISNLKSKIFVLCLYDLDFVESNIPLKSVIDFKKQPNLVFLTLDGCHLSDRDIKYLARSACKREQCGKVRSSLLTGLSIVRCQGFTMASLPAMKQICLKSNVAWLNVSSTIFVEKERGRNFHSLAEYDHENPNCELIRYVREKFIEKRNRYPHNSLSYHFFSCSTGGFLTITSDYDANYSSDRDLWKIPTFESVCSDLLACIEGYLPHGDHRKYDMACYRCDFKEEGDVVVTDYEESSHESDVDDEEVESFGTRRQREE